MNSMEPTGRFRWYKKAHGGMMGGMILQQEFVKLTLDRAIKIWIDVPVVEEIV